ncbi:MAG: cyclic nucleotide-binding domain-containing protein [Verrucomicrobiaceae bacterium]|nr:MAG: cyclic nucleotide-binding domain-containing protein [Verrucomicrobiaceae bacterium]
MIFIMSDIMEFLRSGKLEKFGAGEEVIRQGSKTGCLFFLMEGTVEILRDGVSVATASEPGVVFGEMSALLEAPHTATVRTTTPCTFCVVPDSLAFLESSQKVSHSVCTLLAQRLNVLNKYLVDVKHSLEGDDRLDIVIKTLEGLLHHHPLRSRPDSVHNSPVEVRSSPSPLPGPEKSPG